MNVGGTGLGVYNSLDNKSDEDIESAILPAIPKGTFSSVCVVTQGYNFGYLPDNVVSRVITLSRSKGAIAFKVPVAFLEAIFKEEQAIDKYEKNPDGNGIMNHILGNQEADEEFRKAYQQARVVKIWVSNDMNHARVKVGKSLVIHASQAGREVGAASGALQRGITKVLQNEAVKELAKAGREAVLFVADLGVKLLGGIIGGLLRETGKSVAKGIAQK